MSTSNAKERQKKDIFLFWLDVRNPRKKERKRKAVQNKESISVTILTSNAWEDTRPI